MLGVKHPRFHRLTLKWTSPNPNFALPYRNYLSRPQSSSTGSSDRFPPLTGYRFKLLIHKQQALFVNPVGFVHRGELLCHIDRSERSSRIKRF